MTMFGNLSTDGLEEAQDRLGGFRVLDSGPYTGKIKAAYAGVSANSKAQSITVILETREDGEYKETFWVTNKNDENFSVKDGKKKALTGFTHVDDLCLVTTNKPLSQQVTEDKVMNIYDPDQKKEMPKSVKMLVELLGKEVTFGIKNELKNKQEKDGNGVYQDTAGERNENVTDKVFHYPSNLTVVEAKKQIQTPTFYGAWVERNKGQVHDRRSIKDGAAGGQAGRSGRPAGNTPPKAGDNAPKTSSLFGA